MKAKEEYAVEEPENESLGEESEIVEDERNLAKEPMEEVEEREEDAEEAKPVKRWNKVKALKEHSRELERQNAELLAALQEKEQDYSRINNQNLYNYGSNALSQLKNAEAVYKQALQVGTVDDITSATANYNMALNDYRKAEEVINSFQQEKEYKQQQSAYPDTDSRVDDSREKELLAQRWLKENPDLNKNSPYYDPRLTELVLDEIEKYDDYLDSQGAGDFKGTRDYLDKVDEFVEFFKNSSQSKLKGYSVNTRNKVTANTGHRTIALTSDEMKIASGLGMTAKEYKELQAKMPARYRTKR